MYVVHRQPDFLRLVLTLGMARNFMFPDGLLSVIRCVFRLEPISFHISSYPVLATYHTLLVFLFGESTRKTHCGEHKVLAVSG